MVDVTIPDEATVVEFDASSVGPHAFDFTYFDKADLRVSIDDIELPQSAFTHTPNTAKSGGYDGGSITLNAAVSGGVGYVWRVVQTVRSDVYTAGPLSPQTISRDMTRLVAMAQDARRDISRAALVAFGESGGYNPAPEFVHYPVERYRQGSESWHLAKDKAAAAAAAAGGGIVTFFEQKQYPFDDEGDDIPDNVLLLGIPNHTEILAPTGDVPFTAFNFEPGTLDASFTLGANITAGAATIQLTSVSGLAAGDWIRIQKTPGGSITLGKYTAWREIERIDGNIVSLVGRLPQKLAVQTSDTYTIRKASLSQGGGADGFIFKGTGNTSARCIGVYALYFDGKLFDNIGGVDMAGGNPMNGTTVSGVLHLWGGVNTRGLNWLWSRRSGSGSAPSLYFREMGRAAWGSIACHYDIGFGFGWYDCEAPHVASVLEDSSFGRSGKMQCCLDFKVMACRSGNARFTGFAATEGSTGWFGSASYDQADLQYFPVVSLQRISNVAYITFSEPTYTYDSGHPFVIAGAVSATDFNGLKTLVKVAVPGNVYSYASVGPDETATGTILCNLNRSPSCWVNDTGCQVLFAHLHFEGASNNTAGDLHTGSTDLVTVLHLTTANRFAPLFAGTAGSSANGTGRRVYDVNGEFFLPDDLTVAADLTVTNGQLRVTATGKQPFQTFAENFQYSGIYGSAASSSTVGLGIYSRDSGGVQHDFIIRGSSGVAELRQAAADDINVYINNVLIAGFPSTGGFKIAGTKVLGSQGAAVADASGGATVDTEARAQLNTLLARLRAHGLIAT